MSEFTEIYVLSNQRSAADVAAFLDAFAATREETADEYEVPQYAESPAHIFKQAAQLIGHCCRHLDEVHAIYWRTPSGPAAYAMVFFLADGHVIYGLSVDAADVALIGQLRQALVRHTGSAGALIAWESPPPHSAQAFAQALANCPG